MLLAAMMWTVGMASPGEAQHSPHESGQTLQWQYTFTTCTPHWWKHFNLYIVHMWSYNMVVYCITDEEAEQSVRREEPENRQPMGVSEEEEDSE